MSDSRSVTLIRADVDDWRRYFRSSLATPTRGRTRSLRHPRVPMTGSDRFGPIPELPQREVRKGILKSRAIRGEWPRKRSALRFWRAIWVIQLNLVLFLF